MTESRHAPYPVRVDAAAEPAASRGLWLVKWLLLIPHFVVLAFLWPVFVIFSVVAFVAILATGRYPRALFDFDVGVLRWSWRVHYYGYAALGTDRYPPFTLAEVPDYPAHLEVPYPERLSRGLVLVKWWLLALPHYVVLGLFIGGGIWFGAQQHTGSPVWDTSWGAGGLVGLLVLIAAVVVLFTGRYPRALYDFVLGMDRWALRVAAYAALMTDAYPPFRLDMGGPDPGSVPASPVPPFPPGPAVSLAKPAAPAGPARPGGWSAGRIVAVVVGAVLLFTAAGTLVAGGGLLWADRTQRDHGYLSSPAATVSSHRYAVVTDNFRLEGAGLGWAVDRVIGTARLQATPAGHHGDLFLGVGRTADVQRYLRGVGYTELTAFGARWDAGMMASRTAVDHAGGAPAVPPEQAGVWAAWTTGDRAPSLTWRPTAGDWTVVIMRADGALGVVATAQVGATLPGATWIAAGLLGVGAVLLAAGGLLVGLAAHGASAAARRGDSHGTGAGPGGAGTSPEPVLTGRPGR